MQCVHDCDGMENVCESRPNNTIVEINCLELETLIYFFLNVSLLSY